MKKKIDNQSWINGFLYGGLFVVLIVLSGKFIYRAMEIIELREAKIISFILGLSSLLAAVFILIKFYKKNKYK